MMRNNRIIDLTIPQQWVVILSLSIFFILAGAFRVFKPYSYEFVDELDNRNYEGLATFLSTSDSLTSSSVYGLTTHAEYPLELNLRIPKRPGVEGALFVYNYAPADVQPTIEVLGDDGRTTASYKNVVDRYTTPFSLSASQDKHEAHVRLYAPTQHFQELLVLDRIGFELKEVSRPVFDYLLFTLPLILWYSVLFILCRNLRFAAFTFLLPALGLHSLLEHLSLFENTAWNFFCSLILSTFCFIQIRRWWANAW